MSAHDARTRRREDVDRAHSVQIRAGLLGAAQYGAVGFGALTLAHYALPAFRRQPLPLKGFLLSAISIYGLVLHAEDALIEHETTQRRTENDLRKAARIDLARRGLVATETEILRWKAEHGEGPE